MICVVKIKNNRIFPKDYHLENSEFKKLKREKKKGTGKAWKKYFKPVNNVANPFIALVVGAKLKNPAVGSTTKNILKSISGGKVLSLTDMHGNGLRLNVTYS